jgi:hypothetical protein
MARSSFYDPTLGTTSNFLINYEELTGPDQQDQVSYEGNAGGTGIIGTKGDKAPLLLHLTGKCVHQVQKDMFLRYKALDTSFKFTDEDSNAYEVTMTGLAWVKKGCSYNQFDASMRRHYWTYTMELTIIRVISGEYAGLI